MSGFIVQPQTLFAIGTRQFGGNTNPSTTTPSAGTSNQNPIFSGYVTISENTIDAIEITQQPVQQGASITDHAFKKPGTLTIQMIMAASLFGDSLSTIYQKLLNLQSSFQPFNCITPKRTYTSMLFAALGVTTEKKTENIIAINASFQQIITVPIGITTISRANLKNPGNNGATQNAGAKQLQSALYTGVNGFGQLIGGGQ